MNAKLLKIVYQKMNFYKGKKIRVKKLDCTQSMHRMIVRVYQL